MSLRIALVGNPNCGKSTTFNSLTGDNQYVGNWPGVTVEKKEGRYTLDKDIVITDLPGVYSLSPYTPEEIVARDYLLGNDADVVINLIDATNLERSLYLTSQVLDLGIPVVIGLNMMDLVEKKGDLIDIENLKTALNCPVVEVTALREKGLDKLVETARMVVASQESVCPLLFDEKIEKALKQAEEILLLDAALELPQRWLAIKSIEGEATALETLSLSEEQQHQLAELRAYLEREYSDDDLEGLITAERYQAIARATEDVYRQVGAAQTTSERIDRAVTSRWLGLPIFVAVMALVYYLAITVGTGVVTDWANDGISGDGFLYTGRASYEQAVSDYEDTQKTIDAYLEVAKNHGVEVEGIAAARETEDPSFEDEQAVSDFLENAGKAGVEIEKKDAQTGKTSIIDSNAIAQYLTAEEPDASDGSWGLWLPGLGALIGAALADNNVAPWLQSLIMDGVVSGVGAVIGFVPQMAILFLLLGLLEGCGYLARVAFVMDRMFRRFGLSGKSFIPMLIASGCGVPAVMATKTIENEKDRRMTIMTTTMVPCGAKMPIIALVFGAVAGGNTENTWWITPLFYFLAIIAIIASCVMLKKTRYFASEATPFIMELPSYQIPTLKSVLESTWDRIKGYLVKAGTVIFLSTIVIWLLMNMGDSGSGFGLLDPEQENYLQYSLLAGIGNAVSWIFAPLGFGDWQATVTSFTGLIAKENVVATVGVITSLGEVGEADPNLWSAFAAMMGNSTPAILAFCAFNLLCAPCVAAIAVIWQQMASSKWALIAVGYMTGFAWLIGLLIYQFGGLTTGELTFNFWTVIALVVAAVMLFQLFRPQPLPTKAKNKRRYDGIFRD